MDKRTNPQTSFKKVRFKKAFFVIIIFQGYSGSLKDIENKIQLERYQSSKAELTYKEYLEMKKNK